MKKFFSSKMIIHMLLLILFGLVFRLIISHNCSYEVINDLSSDTDENSKAIETEYFRPSKLPILNDKAYKSDFFSQFYGEEVDNITIPNDLLKDPEDTIINYFSVLKHAANHVEGKWTGCGTLGYARVPYPIAYNFLSDEYKEKLNYDDYLKLYENILHLNLIKLQLVPDNELCNNGLRYFVEFETIEGSESGIGYFAYYYGYICLTREGENYKIANMDFQGEDYLCAPYHGWNYIAEAAVDIKYGNWCSLVKERYKTQQEGYIKNIFFKGTDENEYLIQFYQLTNGKDIEIAQFMKNQEEQWVRIQLNPEDCLDLD